MIVVQESPSVRSSRGGRPRDPSRDGLIRAAIMRLLADVGYGALTMDAVAAEAGVGKATIYRRWRTKQDLVVDTIAELNREEAAAPDQPALAEAFRSGPLEVWRTAFNEVWSRAEQRGELRPGVSGSLSAEATS